MLTSVGGMGNAKLKLGMTSQRGEVGDAAWRALAARDRASDGRFVYVATTTGIYCRPSCPARLPNRRNTLIIQTAAEAERQGYKACQRCHPASNALTPAERSIRAALDYIESHQGQAITLNTLSPACGLSPNHLQLMFKRIVGLSPKAYCAARSLARLKECLKTGESVSSSCYEAGYGSSRGLYETARRGLGMTPAIYRRGSEGVQIRYAISRAVLGRMLLAWTSQGVCAILLGRNDEVLVGQLHQEFPRACFSRRKAIPGRWAAASRSHRREDPLLSRLPMSTREKVLQAKMWRSLQ